MAKSNNSEWFDQIYKETYPIVKRAGRILLVHFCPALLDDLEELISCTYMALCKKEKKLREHPNITGWLIVAFRYEYYHRVRAWDRQRRLVERLKAQKKVETVPDVIQNAMEFRETRELIRIVIGDDRYDLLYAYRCEGISVRELAKRTGRSAHAMEVSLSRWQKTCRKALKTSGKTLIPILWIGVSFCPLMGVLGVRA